MCVCMYVCIYVCVVNDIGRLPLIVAALKFRVRFSIVFDIHTDKCPYPAVKGTSCKLL